VSRAVFIAVRLGGLTLAAVLLAAWLVLPVPLVLKILPALALVVSLVRPDAGLLLVAALGPLGDVVSVWAQSPYVPARLFEQLVLAVVVGAGVRVWRREPVLRLAGPGLLVAAVAIASAVAVQPVLLMKQTPGAAAADYLRTLFRGGYFERTGPLDPIFLAALAVEGVALAVVAERLVREHAGLAVRVVQLTVLGHAGVALVTLERMLAAALHTDSVVRSLGHMLVSFRISSYADVNAAGSVFAMVLVAGAGLLADRRSRWPMALALALVAAGLWISGSRAAFAASAVVILCGAGIVALRTRGAARWIAAAAALAVILAGVWGIAHYPPGRNSPVAMAARTRTIMAGVAMRMWRTAPVLGVGVGRFYDESAAFGADELRVEWLGASNENAHNNFLQVLAEQGIVGLGALLLALGVVLVPAVRARTDMARPPGVFLPAGIGVFLLTWLAGHPLLVPEAAFVFWLLLGVLAGATSPPVRRGPTTALAIAAVALLITAPARAEREIRTADFEHVGVGLSVWRPALDGVRYREAGANFALYLPADGRAVALPLRRAPGAPDPLVLTLSLNGRPLTDVRLSGDGWSSVPLELPNDHRQFELVRFAVAPATPAADGAPLVLMGKAESRSP